MTRDVEVKICPVMSHRGCPKSHVQECLAKRCAWWDSQTRTCAIVALLEAIDGHLSRFVGVVNAGV